jgi:hypothetical protein
MKGKLIFIGIVFIHPELDALLVGLADKFPTAFRAVQ